MVDADRLITLSILAATFRLGLTFRGIADQTRTYHRVKVYRLFPAADASELQSSQVGLRGEHIILNLETMKQPVWLDLGALALHSLSPETVANARAERVHIASVTPQHGSVAVLGGWGGDGKLAAGLLLRPAEGGLSGLSLHALRWSRPCMLT